MKQLVLILSVLSLPLWAQGQNTNQSKFRQLSDQLATPNMYRTGGGAPGAFYYQQQANYSMNIRLDDENQRIYGEQTVTYINNAPESLDYLWVQLDQKCTRAKQPHPANKKWFPRQWHERKSN